MLYQIDFFATSIVFRFAERNYFFLRRLLSSAPSAKSTNGLLTLSLGVAALYCCSWCPVTLQHAMSIALVEINQRGCYAFFVIKPTTWRHMLWPTATAFVFARVLEIAVLSLAQGGCHRG